MNKPWILVNSQTALVDVCDDLQRSDWLALDTEFERTNTYFPELCLLQISNKDTTVIIDPLELDDLSILYDLLYKQSIIKIFHAARQDMELFYLLQDSLPSPVFDTQVAAAALGLGDQVGYANLIRDVLDIELAKTETRTNWKRRPLTDKQLDYAADDVVYLAQVYEVLLAELNKQNKLCSIESAFAALTDVDTYKPKPDEMWKKFKSREAKKLSGNNLEALKQLAAWRENTAIEENKPRKWVLENHTILEIAMQLPEDIQGLKKIKGINQYVERNYAELLLEIIKKL